MAQTRAIPQLLRWRFEDYEPKKKSLGTLLFVELDDAVIFLWDRFKNVKAQKQPPHGVLLIE